MDHSKLVGCLNTMNDSFRRLVCVDMGDREIRAFCLAYDEAYGLIMGEMAEVPVLEYWDWDNLNWVQA